MPQSIKVINFNFVSYFCCNSFYKKGKRFFASTEMVINFIISIMLIVIHFSAKIKKKMLYSSSFDALKKCLVGVQKYIQVSQQSASFMNCLCLMSIDLNYVIVHQTALWPKLISFVLLHPYCDIIHSKKTLTLHNWVQLKLFSKYTAMQ